MKPVALLHSVLPPKFLRLAFCWLWIVISISNHTVLAQSTIQWETTLGGDNFEDVRAVFETPDGGFIFGASTSSSGNGDISQISYGFSDYWIGKLDANGNLLWEINYGGDNIDQLQAVKPTADGGYILGGYSKSSISGDKSEANINPFSLDYWVIKVDATGVKQWDRTLGGQEDEFFWDLEVAHDGGYILAGNTFSDMTGNISENNYGISDYWIVKLAANGNLEWEKVYGGDGQDWCFDVLATSDGNYLISGHSGSGANGNKTTASQGSNDFWTLKIDPSGNIIWQQSFGGTGDDQIHDVVEANAGGFLLAGYSNSDISPEKTEANLGDHDYWVVRIDNNGNKLWDRTLGGAGKDQLQVVQQNSKGTYLLGGLSGSGVSGTKTVGSNGQQDYYLVFLSDAGIVHYDDAYGAASLDDMYSCLLYTSPSPRD